MHMAIVESQAINRAVSVGDCAMAVSRVHLPHSKQANQLFNRSKPSVQSQL